MRVRTTVALAVLCLIVAPRLHAQAVGGRLLDRDSGAPVPAATLTLLDVEGQARAGTATDSLGAFRFSAVRPGAYRLRIARVGYAPTTTEMFEVSARESVELDMRLEAAAVPMIPVVVTARAVAPRVAMLESRGFYDRMTSRNGTFLTREQIESRKPRETIELFRTVRGFRVVPQQRRPGFILTAGRGGTGGTCRPHVFLDGLHLKNHPGDWVDAIYAISPEHIAGIEAYPGPATIPLQFNPNGQACAAVLIWTRDGRD